MWSHKRRFPDCGGIERNPYQRVDTVGRQLFFVSTPDFVHQPNFGHTSKTVTIDMSAAHVWDGSAVGALDRVILKFRSLEIPVGVVGLNGALAQLLDRPASHDMPGRAGADIH